MKYGDLIKFDPIETVVQLREADVEKSARRLVETFVISTRMGEQLCDMVFPQLQFAKPGDNKGLLVVGNYGTGKSHLMALISAVAEHEDLAPCLTNPAVADKAAMIAGRFKVIRAEIGSTTMSLRDILCRVLEEGLDRLGVSYEFPDLSERHENKSAFQEMMAAFQAEYPDQGLLLALDELLDYMRSRRDQELSLDLSFLREVGEVCKGTRFRFISGVQEALFDNPRFQFVADTLRRVKDRFEQVRIAREDVAYVVSERLLKKDAKQQALIRDHLTGFAQLYGTMNERMDEFVRLFPVHPAYLDTFERVYVAEKREVLKTLSVAIKGLTNQQVPQDAPGLIAYDSYWQTLKDNPSFRSVTEIKDVIDKADVLEARIQQAFTRPQYRPAALRVINALAVHRLTHDDIYSPMGATAEELRDDLCILLPVPEKDAEFLRTMIETVLKEIVRTVSGQFLSYNKENGQYFLDLKKNIDFDSLIEKKAETLGDDKLDSYYFDALRRVVLEDPDAPPYVTGYRIWEHEVEWRERKAKRSGYLFFGAPNQRSTAQPPRDFYLFFLQPFDPPYFKDEKRADEVFFRLKHRDEDFEQALKLYAGARELATTASGSNKKIYEEKSMEHLRSLTTWLREHMTTAVEVAYQGRSCSLAEVTRGKIPGGFGRATVRDLIDAAGTVSLATHFQDRSPDYPIFTVAVTRQNRGQYAQDALRWIAGGVKSKPGTAILDALELLDGDQLKARQSRYAQHVLDLLSQKGQGQVVNRSELIEDEHGVDYWTRFRMEPEFLAVVLAALVHSGDLVLRITGKKLDAAGVGNFAKMSIGDISSFKHVERPRDLPMAPLQELFELLGISKGLLVDLSTRDEAVKQLHEKVAVLVERAVEAQAHLPDLVLWGKPVLSDQEQGAWRKNLGTLKTFLESLQPFNTPGKLKNFPHDVKAVTAQQASVKLVREVDELSELVKQLSPMTSYLGKAEAVLEASHAWVDEVREKRGELLSRVASPKHRADPSFQRSLGQTLAELRARYQDAYVTIHQNARLGANEDKQKARLSKDPRLTQLQKLVGVEMMPTQQLRSFENKLFNLKTCFSLTKKDLEADPICPHCGFRPMEEGAIGAQAMSVLDELDDQLDALLKDWTTTLLGNLEDPTVASNVELLTTAKGKTAVADFIKRKELPEQITPDFIKALQEVLSGLKKVSLTQDDLQAALISGGVPCTVKELKERFDSYVAKLTKGQDGAKVRIVVED